MTDLGLNVKFITGELKLEPVEYRVWYQPDGSVKVGTDYMTITGDADMIYDLLSIGCKVRIMNDVVRPAPRRRWWGFWR